MFSKQLYTLYLCNTYRIVKDIILDAINNYDDTV